MWILQGKRKAFSHKRDIFRKMEILPPRLKEEIRDMINCNIRAITAR